ncbi:MAG TPA: fibronectin type III domain-containing protein [Cellulomonas sp.]
MIAATRNHRARAGILAATGIGAAVVLAGLPIQAAVATTEIHYTEQNTPIDVGQYLTVSDPGPYDGKTVEFAVQSADSSDVLSLRQDSAPSAVSGEVTIVGSVVYLGNGSTAEQIGTVDSTKNGAAGTSLQINFSSAFANAGFETGDLTGWTAVNQQVDLGVTSINGYVATDDSTYPSSVTNHDDNAPVASSYSSTVVGGSNVSEGSYALQLSSSMTTLAGYDVVHGPAVYSSTFTASAGDVISFDWRAYAGADNFHVFGYVVDQNGHQTDLLDATGGQTAWTTKTTTIPADGTYTFVFVAGTHDLSGGRAAGATLLIDNVRVYGQRVDATVLNAVAAHLVYSSTTDAPTSSRTITETATTQSGSTATSDALITIAPVDDPPTITGPGTTHLTNEAGDQTYATSTGTLSGSDPDGDVLTYGIDGATARSATIDGQTYTAARTGRFGTLYIDAASGRYAFVPNATAVDAQTTAATEQFTVTVTASGVTASSTCTVAVDIATSVPGTPGAVTATAGNAQATLTWTAPTWLGGSAVSGYLIERSDDGGATWTVVVADTGSTATSYTATGLTGGTTTTFRVSAINATGTSAASSTVQVTAYAPPSAPTILSVTGGAHQLTVAFAAPTDVNGSAITGYEYSLDGGATWTLASSTTSPLVIRGLDNDKAYSVQLRAVNAAGGGAASLAVAGTTTLAPISVPGVTGSSLPEVPAGESWLLVDDVRQPVTISTADGAWNVTGDGFTVRLQATETDGSPLEVDPAGRLVVHASGSVQVSGTGFLPGSTADVWLFSTPYLLGQVTVGADGTFAQEFALPEGIETGAHTIQLNGVGTDGSVRSLSTGVVVLADAASTPLASTGAQSVPLGLLGVALLGLGILTVRVRRLVVRRREPVMA